MNGITKDKTEQQAPQRNERYFAYDPDGGGTELFRTLEEAMRFANYSLQYYRDDARHDGEWPEEVDRVCIGVITHAAAAKGSESEGFDYEMVPVAAAPAAPVSEGVELLCRERAELAAKLIAGADWQEHGIHPKGPLFGAKDMRRAAALLLDGREWNDVMLDTRRKILQRIGNHHQGRKS